MFDSCKPAKLNVLLGDVQVIVISANFSDISEKWVYYKNENSNYIINQLPLNIPYNVHIY